MTEWTYYAGKRATLQAGLQGIRRFGVMWRGSRNSTGAMISNVAHLRPGDLLHFVYRDGKGARYIFRARLATPTTAVSGARAIGRVGGAAGAELRAAGYPSLPDGTVEVLHLVEVEELPKRPLVRAPTGQTAIRRGQPELMSSSPS